MKIKPIGSNMTELQFCNGVTVLFSYETPVAMFAPGKGACITEKKWSATTTRHINKWLSQHNLAVSSIETQEYFDDLVKVV